MATPTKILSRIKDPLTGEEYYIGTTGQVEKVTVTLSAPSQVDWTQYSVTVQNITQSTSTTVALNASGICTFNVPMGELYEVTLPLVTGYIQPTSRTYMATLAARSIEYTYSTTPLQYEQVDIEFDLHTSGSDTKDIFNGLLVYATDTNNVTYEATVLDGYATIQIPYGKHYTLTFPTVEGYYHDHLGEEHTSGVISREILVNYYEFGLGVYGVKSDGTKLLPAEITEQIAAGTLDANEIIAGYYNDSYLVAADRGDGTTGCGFMWKITGGTTSGYWANPSVAISTSLMPYRDNETKALADCAGKHNTRIMDEVITDAGSVTIAHDLRDSTKSQYVLTIGGVDRQGFMLAYGQIKRLLNNRDKYEALYTALGKSAPAIWSSYWWTSCQYNTTSAVRLNGGGFDDRNAKSYSLSVLVGYDI